MREFSGELDGEITSPGEMMSPLGYDDASFEDLMRLAAQRDHEGHDAQRWRLLRDAVLTLTPGLSLDDLLAKVVEVAADLAGAGHAALGVLDRQEKRRLRLLVTNAIAGEHATRTSRFPEGRGALGLLLDRHESHPTDAAPRAGVLSEPPAPDRHAPRQDLTVPMRLGAGVLGTLHLTHKMGGPAFTDLDEQVVAALAASAGVAVENAWLHEEASRRERWLSAAAELTSAILSPEDEDEDRAAQIVADRARDISGADLAWVVAGPDATHLRLQAVSGVPATVDVMASVDFSSSLERCVAVTGHPLTVKHLSDHPRGVDVARFLGTEPAARGVLVPLQLPGGLAGVVCLAWRRDVEPSDVLQDASLPSLLVEQAAMALQVARAHHEQERLAVLADRDRIARDLHDLVIQHLYAVGLELQSIAADGDPEEMRRRLDRTVDDIDDTIRDIRRSIFALGSVQDATDPRAVVNEVVERAARTMKLRPTLRFRGPVRALVDGDLLPDILAVLTESLANTMRHAQARICAVELSVVDGLTVRVTDDGVGMDGDEAQSGLANIRQRAEQRGGHLGVISARGHGTSVVWWVPLTSTTGPGPSGSGPSGSAPSETNGAAKLGTHELGTRRARSG